MGYDCAAQQVQPGYHYWEDGLKFLSSYTLTLSTINLIISLSLISLFAVINIPPKCPVQVKVGKEINILEALHNFTGLYSYLCGL